MAYALTAVSLLVVSGVSVWTIWITIRDGRTRDRSWEKKETVWAVERQQLLDRIMYMADKPWEIPEMDTETVHEGEEYVDPTMTPIELADYYDFQPSGRV
jgi:hypothetical protein